MTCFFTADTHFGHGKIMEYCHRPFNSTAEMDETMYTNWLNTVKPDDTVYHLGDVAFGNRESVEKITRRLKTLPGRKYLVPGNHDYRYPSVLFTAFDKILPPIFEMSATTRDGFGHRLVLSHYPMLTWNGLYKGSVQLFGHVHGRIRGNSLQLDVGVDVWDFMPVSIDRIVRRLSKLPKFVSPESDPQECP